MYFIQFFTCNMFNSIFSVLNSQMNSQNVGRNGKRYKKKQRDRTKSDLKKYHSSWMDVVPKNISGLLCWGLWFSYKSKNKNNCFSSARSDLEYLLAHTRYNATQIQEFYRCAHISKCKTNMDLIEDIIKCKSNMYLIGDTCFFKQHCQ